MFLVSYIWMNQKLAINIFFTDCNFSLELNSFFSVLNSFVTLVIYNFPF